MKIHRSKLNFPVSCSCLTVSDTRTEIDDESGKIIRELLTQSSHKVVSYAIVKDDPVMIRQFIGEQVRSSGVEAIIINGGTGISNRDMTFEAIESLIEKKIDGFGELFRSISYNEIGSPAMLSRAIAGIYSGRALFSVPGSVNAVRLAMERLILPELNHIIELIR